MNEESLMLKRAAKAAGAMIHNSLEGNSKLSWETGGCPEDDPQPQERQHRRTDADFTLCPRPTRNMATTAPPSYGTGNKSSAPRANSGSFPVIPLALRLLRAVPPKTYDRLTWVVPPKASDWLVDVLIHAARQTKTPGRVSDIIQGLVEDRKQLGVYHTLPASAALMAHLAVPEDDQRWSNPQKAVDFRMADYACGCGELLTAAYRRLRELHQAQGQDPSDIHHQMMTNAITAVDVLPASVAIAATELDLLEAEPKGTPSSQTRAITLQQGPINNPRKEKKTTAEAGKKPKQRPVGLGSLDPP